MSKYKDDFKKRINDKNKGKLLVELDELITYIFYQLLHDPEYKDPELVLVDNIIRHEPEDIDKAVFFRSNYRLDILDALIGNSTEIDREKKNELISLMVDQHKLNKFLIDFKKSREGKTYENFE